MYSTFNSNKCYIEKATATVYVHFQRVFRIIQINIVEKTRVTAYFKTLSGQAN